MGTACSGGAGNPAAKGKSGEDAKLQRVILPSRQDTLPTQPSQSNSFARNSFASNSSHPGIQGRFAYSSTLLVAFMGTILVPSNFYL